MSAVINKAKQNYRYYLKLTLLLQLLVAMLIWGLCGANVVSFLLGALSSFLPYCLFVYWIFFRQKSVMNTHKMTAFYQGEALKWLATILCVVGVLKGYPELHLLLFALGYFLILLCNSLLPFLLKQRA